jgi:hypothetical protein
MLRSIEIVFLNPEKHSGKDLVLTRVLFGDGDWWIASVEKGPV